MAIFLFGCTQAADKSGQSTTDTTVKTAKEYMPQEGEAPPKPFMFDRDESSELDGNVIMYYSLIRSGDRKKAIELFLPSVGRTAETLIIKDIELAAESPASYAPKKGQFIWFQDGKIWLRNGAELLDSGEIERLITLSKAHEKAAVVVTVFEDGGMSKMFAVKYQNKFYLLP